MAGTKHRDPITVALANIERHRVGLRHWRRRLAIETRRAGQRGAAEARPNPEARP